MMAAGNIKLVSKMRGVLCLVMGVLWIGSAEARELKIAAWNLEHFAEITGTGCKPRTDEDYALARKYADDLNADIIAVSEVQNELAVARVFDPAKYSIEITRQDLRAEYVCDSKDPNSNRSTRQLTGFVIRKGIPYQRNADFNAIDVSKDQSLRAATDITLTGKQPIRLLSVHLKASCPSQPSQSEKRDCQKLFQQQLVLEEQWMEPRHKAGERLIVLGDFNRHLLKDGDDFWALTNDGMPEQLKMRVLSGAKEDICVAKYPYRIDHIVIDDNLSKQIKPNSFKVLKFAKEGEPSDHCPISVTLQTP